MFGFCTKRRQRTLVKAGKLWHNAKANGQESEVKKFGRVCQGSVIRLSTFENGGKGLRGAH